MLAATLSKSPSASASRFQQPNRTSHIHATNHVPSTIKISPPPSATTTTSVPSPDSANMVPITEDAPSAGPVQTTTSESPSASPVEEKSMANPLTATVATASEFQSLSVQSIATSVSECQPIETIDHRHFRKRQWPVPVESFTWGFRQSVIQSCGSDSHRYQSYCEDYAWGSIRRYL